MLYAIEQESIAFRLASGIVAFVTVVALSLGFAPLTASANSIEPNPDLEEACGLDIALVLDRSGSMSGTPLQDEKNAAKAFVNAFLPGTPTKMGVVSYSSSASTDQALTDSVSDLESAIDAIGAAGLTNWEDGLLKGREMLEGPDDRDDSEHPDLLVMFSDGNPNQSNSGGGAIADARNEANASKTSSASLPIRILGVALGSTPTISSFKEITDGAGSVVSPPAAISKDTDIVQSDFDDLADALGEVAAALCDQAGGDVTVVNDKGAVVENTTVASADTGDNTANGGKGNNGGNGGDIANGNGGDQDVDDSSTGNGGGGGNGGNGGVVVTGNAEAGAGTINLVNTNITRINRCACNGGDSGDDTVRNRDRAYLGNLTAAGAGTGSNGADGDNGGKGGNGGDIYNGGGEDDQDVDNSHTGNGGRGGSGGSGGGIVTEEGVIPGVLTGHATAISTTVNDINRIDTRIRR